LRRLIVGGGGRRLVYVAFTLFDIIHRRVWSRAGSFGRLVRPSIAKTNPMSRSNAQLSGRVWLLIAILLTAAGTWTLFHREINRQLSVRLLLRSENPREDWFESLANQFTDPSEFLERCWETGKVTHRQLVASFLKDRAMAKTTWWDGVEALLRTATVDGDMSVRELALATMEARKDPRLFECAQAQLTDPDPLVRQLGLDYLRRAEAKKGVPLFVKLLDDPDLRVAARAEVALARWSGEDFGARARLAIPSPNGQDGQPTSMENVEKLRQALEHRKAWWQLHAQEFPTNQALVAGAKPTTSLGPPLADFSLKDLDGRTVRLADFKGRPVLLNFWATWCTACLAEIPDLVALQKELGARIAVIGVALDGVTDEHGHVPGQEGEGEPHHEGKSMVDIRKKVGRAVKARGINYTVLLDPSNAVGGRFNGGELPTTVIIDDSGRVRRRFIGERNLQVFEAMLTELSSPPK
jgi:thiol-disulfide isomerase/thioredoxin